MAYFPFTGLVWVEGHALVLLSRRAGDDVAVVERRREQPREPDLTG